MVFAWRAKDPGEITGSPYRRGFVMPPRREWELAADATVGKDLPVTR